MLASLVSILAFLALAIAAFGIGRPLLRGLRIREADRCTLVAMSGALGLVGAGCLLLVLALSDVFDLPAIAVLTMIACCWGFVEIVNLVLGTNETLPLPLSNDPLQDDAAAPLLLSWPPPSARLLGCLLAIACATSIVSLLYALSPLTADTAITGPLEQAKRLLVEHHPVFSLHSPRAGAPLLIDLWYGWALALEGSVCAQLLPWGLGLLLFAGTIALATPLLGRRWAIVAACLVVITPAVSQEMSLPSESIALAAFCTLALNAWWRAVIHGGDAPWFIVAGAMAGAAIGIHHAAVLLAVPIVVLTAVATVHQVEQRAFLIRGSLTSLLVALATGGLFCLPAFWHSGVLPSWRTAAYDLQALAKTVGLIPLGALPGLLLTRRLRGLGTIILTAIVYLVLAAALQCDSRFLLPAVPLLCVAAAWCWIEMRRFPVAAERAATTVFALILLASTGQSLVRSPDPLLVSLGIDDREEYLLRSDPTYRAAAVANRVLQPESHILSQDQRTFHFGCRVTCDNADQRLWQAERSSSVGEAVRQLRQQGYTHVLLAEQVKESESDNAARKSALATQATTLTDYRHRTADGSVRRYRLIMLR